MSLYANGAWLRLSLRCLPPRRWSPSDAALHSATAGRKRKHYSRPNPNSDDPADCSIRHCGFVLYIMKQDPNKTSAAAIDAKIGPGAPTALDSTYDRAGSTGERNELGKFLLGHHIAEGLSRASVHAALNLYEVVGGELRQVGSLGHVLAKKPIGVFVRSPLPR